jgi:hypothetical protein
MIVDTTEPILIEKFNMLDDTLIDCLLNFIYDINDSINISRIKYFVQSYIQSNYPNIDCQISNSDINENGINIKFKGSDVKLFTEYEDIKKHINELRY